MTVEYDRAGTFSFPAVLFGVWQMYGAIVRVWVYAVQNLQIERLSLGGELPIDFFGMQGFGMV
ncbi:hypothetical protein CPC08DRAFT_710908 [Agrocybe pediades]|nr:hypothetical protein CPC08DRAFT_710908 [Agrocybe pediades]